MKSASEIAEEIYHGVGTHRKYEEELKAISDIVESAKKEVVGEAMLEVAVKQAVIHGTGVMLCGRVVTNEELYKQPTDYIREARQQAFEEILSIIKEEQPNWNCNCNCYSLLTAKSTEEK